MRNATIARAAGLLTAVAALSLSEPTALAQNEGGGGGGGPIINKPNAGYGTAFNISALGGIGSYGSRFGLGFGGLFGIPIVKDGFIPSLNESFHLEFGMFTNVAFFDFSNDFVWISPVGGVRWDFHILKQFTAYAALRSGVAIGIDNTPTDFYFDGAVGGFWRFSKPVALRFEVGGGVVGQGITGGVAFFL